MSSLKVCLKGLWLDYLTTVAAHHQVEVVLCGTLAKYGHVFSAQTHGFSIFPEVFKTFLRFSTVVAVEFGGVDPAAPRLSQHYFWTRQRSPLCNSRHCCGAFSPLDLLLLQLLPGRSALLPPDVILGPFRHSFRLAKQETRNLSLNSIR